MIGSFAHIQPLGNTSIAHNSASVINCFVNNKKKTDPIEIFQFFECSKDSICFPLYKQIHGRQYTCVVSYWILSIWWIKLEKNVNCECPKMVKWMHRLPLFICFSIKIPIKHCLVSYGVTCIECRIIFAMFLQLCRSRIRFVTGNIELN